MHNHCTLRVHLVAVVVMALCLTSCASKYGPKTTTVNYYPQCYQPVADLRTGEYAAVKAVGAGAAIGVFSSVLLKRKPSDMLVGTSLGALTSYLSHLASERATMDRATAVARTAIECYDREFKQNIAAFKSGKMDNLEFARRYDEIRAGIEETSRILNATSTIMAEKDAQYSQVVAAQSKQDESVVQSTKMWNKARSNMDNVRREVDEQIAAQARIVAALEG